ncbi:MAG: hypothetical protein ABIJ21_06535 [Nanoarchaeota archaeon]
MWIAKGRPGQTGFKKSELEAELNKEYGERNWRRVHEFNGRILKKPEIFSICEAAYLMHSLDREEYWKHLLVDAKDIYDMKMEETESGLDYTIQHEFTRFHDICIRNVVYKRGWQFSGDKLIQIRWNEAEPDWYSIHFDPGKVPFHRPDLIIAPHLKGWWDDNSVEDFYQSNKILQVWQND